VAKRKASSQEQVVAVGQIRKTKNWGSCVLNAKAEGGWNVVFPSDPQPYYLRDNELK
jgi:hypothetical protein